MVTIWGRRWTTARGWGWTAERQCDAASVDAWLNAFRGDEPAVIFVASVKRPR